MKLKPLLSGISTFLPLVNQIRLRGTGGTDSARYCYAVWLRHLVMAKNNGLNSCPKVVAELGPGDSLGIGFAALISGSEKYFAFDVVDYTDAHRNIEIFDELVALFENRANIPGEDEFPNVKPHLKKYDFPADILDQNRLRLALDQSRLEKIRNSIRNPQTKDSPIQYKVPWYDAEILENQSVDMIYSQAVLEHVNDLRNTYRAMRLWLRPTGYISHQIDFRCHGTADEWNGHWTHSDLMWKLIRGRRPYLLNREPHSAHIAILKEEGYRVLCDKAFKSTSNLRREAVVPRFDTISDDDLTTSGAFIQASKAN